MRIGIHEPIDFADGSNRYIRAVGRFAVMLCGITTIKHAANFLGVGWDLVKDAFTIRGVNRAAFEARPGRSPEGQKGPSQGQSPPASFADWNHEHSCHSGLALH